MVSLQPFRASHYNPAQITDLAAVLAPRPRHKEALPPHHFAHIYSPEQSDCLRSAKTLSQWLAEGVFTTTAAPGFYLHRQQFTLNEQARSRTDLFVMCEAIPFEDQLVLPHERTLDLPQHHGLELMQATGASLSSVFSLYSDHEEFLAGYFEEVQENPPLLQFTDPEGTRHTLWQDAIPERVARISAWFRGRQLYIADGHHRYQSALAYRQWQAQQPTASPAGNFLLMHLANIYDPGLCVLPNHRLLTSQGALPPLAEVVARLQRYFTVEALPGEALLKHMAAAGSQLTALGIDYQGHSLLLTRPKGLPEDIATTRSMSYRQLDVAVLHDLVFELLGLPQEGASQPDYFLFSPDPTQIRTWLRTGQGEAAFYLNASSVRELCGVAMAGETMPPKSTHFHPKSPDGMLFASFAHAF
jgi:uncharacterized protein (DUF1015 family)